MALPDDCHVRELETMRSALENANSVQAQPRSTATRKGPVPSLAVEASIDLYWLPLGAGGHFVRFNGRVYEAIQARLERRRPLDLYHSALEVRVPEGRFVIENSWPILDSNGLARGVGVEDPVGNRYLARFRAFRYEIRCWREGVIPDVGEAVGSPQRLSDDQGQAHRLLKLAATVPPLVWGRDELDTGEMWNSNSVISWLLARSGLRAEEIHPPTGGRAPGWAAGIRLAHLSTPIREKESSCEQSEPSRWARYSMRPR